MTEYSASTENLLENGSPEAVTSSPNLYLSLLPRPSKSLAMLTPYRSATAGSYLHPQSSLHISSKTASKRQRKGKRTHRKDSSTSDNRQTEMIKHSFKKQQICFIVLCSINIIMMIVYIATYPKFGPLFSAASDDDFREVDGEIKTFKLCTKCQPLEAKVGFAKGLIDNIRSSKFPEYCCFRRVDQLLALFDGYAEMYVDQEVFKVRREMKINISQHIGMTTINRSLVLAHLYYIETQQVSEIAPLTWMTKGVDILLVGSIRIENNQRLRILHSGYYYLYSHLQLKPNATIVHRIYMNEKLLIENHNSGHITSELQGVFRVERNDYITVFATQNGIKSGFRGNYFGVFMLK